MTPGQEAVDAVVTLAVEAVTLDATGAPDASLWFDLAVAEVTARLSPAAWDVIAAAVAGL